MNNGKVLFFIDSLGGGGAERVVSVLSARLAKKGYDMDVVMLYNRPVMYHIPDGINLIYAEDMPVTTTYGRVVRRAFECWNFFRGRLYIPALRRLGCKNYPKWNETAFYFYARYAMPYREFLKKNPGSTAFGFLIRSNISLLMAARGTGVRTVFCERNNPVRPDMPRNILSLRDRLCRRCDGAVFQTEEERAYYKRLSGPAAVIPNPLKEGLPAPYEGERRREIVNFCRLNKQKNIPLLIEAFTMLRRDHPEYTVRIYGRGEEKENLIALVQAKHLEQCVFFEDFAPDVHERIKDSAMYVCTSDFEGLSNSMLEAMAIGLPCVCTDCAGGGAGMMIRDHENGLLVPVGDARAVYLGMKEIIENPDLGEKLSVAAAAVREQLSVDKIVDRWEAMIG